MSEAELFSARGVPPQAEDSVSGDPWGSLGCLFVDSFSARGVPPQATENVISTWISLAFREGVALSGAHGIMRSRFFIREARFPRRGRPVAAAPRNAKPGSLGKFSARGVPPQAEGFVASVQLWGFPRIAKPGSGQPGGLGLAWELGSQPRSQPSSWSSWPARLQIWLDSGAWGAALHPP